MTTALITGIAGQDGSYLAELLLGEGYRVVGLVRDLEPAKLHRIRHLLEHIELVRGEVGDSHLMRSIIIQYRPTEIYNLAARASSLHLSSDPVATAECNGLAVLRLLEIVRQTDPSIHFCQASSSEIFGKAASSPQSEATPFAPRNAYGVAKLFAHCSTVDYRESHGLFACSAMLYNHESPRRGLEFVTRRISYGAASIRLGLQSELLLGSLDAVRDWGYAPDYVRAMWIMLQQPTAADYVVATGIAHSVREFCEIAFTHVGLDYRDFVRFDPSMARCAEPVQLVGDPGRARRDLGWGPTVEFEGLVKLMVDADLNSLRHGAV